MGWKGRRREERGREEGERRKVDREEIGKTYLIVHGFGEVDADELGLLLSFEIERRLKV